MQRSTTSNSASTIKFIAIPCFVSVECDRVILTHEFRSTSSYIATGTMTTNPNTSEKMPGPVSSKTRTQRPLKRLENNSILLSKFKATGGESRERQRKTPSTGSGSSAVEDETSSSNGSEQEDIPASGSDTDDTLARIQYWSSPRRKLKKPLFNPKPHATPRTLRASRRNEDQGREPPPKPIVPSSCSFGDLSSKLQDYSTSRPSSSSDNDKGARLVQ
jgi:hypothetical protein